MNEPTQRDPISVEELSRQDSASSLGIEGDDWINKRSEMFEYYNLPQYQADAVNVYSLKDAIYDHEQFIKKSQ